MHSVHAPVSEVNVWEPPPLSTVTVPAVMFSGFGLNEKFVAVIVPPPGAGNVVVVVVVVVVGGSVGTGSVGTGSVDGSVDGSVGVGSSVATTALVGGSVLPTVVVVVVVVEVVVVDREVVALEAALDELDAEAFDFDGPPPHATSAVKTATITPVRSLARTPVDTDGPSTEIAHSRPHSTVPTRWPAAARCSLPCLPL